ncbi:ESX secretion-associated protein EspG [Amycolatopsis decaplanina]|uniref:Cytochrome C biogenesis protein CycH n=1 Tax=Amycolatopsis decaplanina DSM 44594 TaxID=1284240 RepID=M2Z8Z0_9PSEU|nr:ESX secretion-associated protein EspG [Amycolatopsis decaplanina]EME63732.1 cytochrome C biogenesis protein CycH [Amycolatopsis decaplanina DSM 44594]
MTITTTPLDEHGSHFELAELDLLATYAGTPPPFPLRIPSSGRIASEREVLLRAAGGSLAERGLATAEEPIGMAADLVAALRGHHSSVDLVLAHQGTLTGFAAMIHGDRAVLCGQPIGGTPGPVAVMTVAYDALADTLANLLPEIAAAPTLPITFPPGAVGDDPAVEALAAVLPSVTGRGQLGVVRGPGDEKRPFELSWLDGPAGRVRIDQDDRGWVSVNPLRHNELVRLIREAAALARQ